MNTHTISPRIRRLAVICTLCGLIRKGAEANGPCLCVGLHKAAS